MERIELVQEQEQEQERRLERLRLQYDCNSRRIGQLPLRQAGSCRNGECVEHDESGSQLLRQVLHVPPVFPHIGGLFVARLMAGSTACALGPADQRQLVPVSATGTVGGTPRSAEPMAILATGELQTQLRIEDVIIIRANSVVIVTRLRPGYSLSHNDNFVQLTLYK